MTESATVFAGLGLDADVEEVYLFLLASPGSSVTEVSGGTGLPKSQTEVALRSCEALGLVSRAPSKEVRFTPREPDVAVEALILRRQEALEDARRRAQELRRRFRSTFEHRRVPELVQLIEGPEAVSQSFLHLQATATSEVMLLDRFPMLLGSRNPIQLERQERGVTYRTVYDSQLLERPESLDWMREATRAGEEARVVADVPAKLAIADGSVALIPLDLHEPELTSTLAVHGSSLLDVLVQLFELLWERAEPLRLDGAEAHEQASGGAADSSQVLALLSAGLKDASIARALGVSHSTVTRRVRAVMEELSATTRFQAGLLAARRGLVADPVDDGERETAGPGPPAP